MKLDSFSIGINGIREAINALTGGSLPEDAGIEQIISVINSSLYYKAPTSGITVSRSGQLSGKGSIPIQTILYNSYSGLSGTAFVFKTNRIEVNHKCKVTVTAYARVIGPERWDSSLWFYIVVNGSSIKRLTQSFRGTQTFTLTHTFDANPDDYITAEIQVSNPQNESVYADSLRLVASAKA